MTSQASEPHGTVGPLGVPAELAQIRHQVRGLADTLWAARGADELMDTITEIEALKSTLDGVELGVVRELDATNAVKTAGWASTQDFVTTIAGGHKGTGPATVRLAAAVDQPLLAPVGEALRDGWLSHSQGTSDRTRRRHTPRGTPTCAPAGSRCCSARPKPSTPPT